MFNGVGTALVTPFNEKGVDFDAYEKLIEYQISNGIDALVVLGTTGEPSTMTNNEKDEVIKFAIKKINKRVPVIIGCGSNCTANAIANSVNAEKLGADMLLVVTPYYNKCTVDGLVAHYTAISNAVNIPIIAYNVPGRTGVNITPIACQKLSKIKNVTAIKEASGNISQISETARLINNTNMTLLSGDDGLILPILSLGAKGLISVASNAIPKEMVTMVHSWLDGDIKTAQNLYFKYLEFINVMFVEPNPIPVKSALNKLGICDNVLRLPLTPLSDSADTKLTEIMLRCNILKQVDND